MAHPLLSLILRRAAVRPAGGAHADADLLRTFAATHDDAAFTELLRRHGPLVWSVCRRVLRHEQDAEDAFQAAFLVLARRAVSIRRGESLASWLYGVAYRTALCARRRTARRDTEPAGDIAVLTDPATTAASREDCAAILEEVRRLPEKYRAPIVLCGLGGKTKAEVARELGWKEGTVSGRLARARELLGRRLLRRGVVVANVSAGMLSDLAIPAGLRAATLRSAAEFLNGAGNSAASVIAREVLSAMTTSLSQLSAGLVAVVLLAAGVVGVAYLRPDADDPPVVSLPPLVAAPGDPTWQEAARLYGTGGYVSLSPDSRVLATLVGDNVMFWDLATWHERSRYDLRQRYGPDHKGFTPWLGYSPFSPNGQTVAVVGSLPVAGQEERRREVTLIDPATGRERGRVPGQEMAFSPKGQMLAVRNGDAITLWDVDAARPTHTLAIGKPLATHHIPFTFSRDGTLLYAVSTERGRLFEVATGQQRGAPGGYLPLFSSDGQTLATLVPGPKVMLWDAATGQQRATLGGFSTNGVLCAFSPDSRMLLTSGWELHLKPDGEFDREARNRPGRFPRAELDMRLWDVTTGAELARLPGRIRLHRSGQFTPDGRTVIYQRLSGREDDMEIVLWDVATRKVRVVLREPGGLEMQFLTPDGTTLFGSSSDPMGRRQTLHRLHRWDIASGRELPRPPDADSVGDSFVAAYAADGKTFIRSVTLPGSKVGQSPDYELRVYRLSAEPLTVVTRGNKPEPEPEPEKPMFASLAEREWDQLTKDSNAADRDFATKAAEAKTPDQQRALGEKRQGTVEAFADRALAIARKYPADSAGVEALLFALRYTNGGTDGKIAELGRAAVDLVKQNHMQSERLGKIVPWLQHQQRDDAEELLQATFEQSPHRTVRGRAAFWLARALTERGEAARLFKQMPELANHPAVKDRPMAIGRLRATNPDAVERRAERLYEVLQKDYADVPKQEELPDDRIGPAAGQALFALRNLGLGKTAPEIEGTDLDGKAVKLSEYRGKVVVLVFCGDWCGPCRAMEPHKREMMKRHADKPFALLEVNSDEDRETVNERMKAEGNMWRCWFDGGREGPIHLRWNVTRWPTIFVLDAKGIIRFKELRDEPLETAVNGLLKEMRGQD